jgi:hypothetical protein
MLKEKETLLTQLCLCYRLSAEMIVEGCYVKLNVFNNSQIMID